MARAIVISGDMDAAAMKTQRQMCEELAACGEDVIVDMSNVEFIDSSGIGAIVFMYKRLLSSGHKLKLQRLKGQPLQLLSYLRLSEIIAT